MSDEWLHAREHPGSEPHGLPETVPATPSQLLTGFETGLPTQRVICIACGAHLREGRAVTVYGYRTADRALWDLRRCYCDDCAPATIETPTLGVTELLAQAWLGTISLSKTRTHRLCLTEVECLAYSPPHVGVEP